VKSFHSQTHYELLEVSVSATGNEIRAAFDRLARLYGDEQIALYGLVDDANAQALRARLKEAVLVLGDDERRDVYDQTIGLPPRDLSPVNTAGWTENVAWVNPVAMIAPLTQTFSFERPIALTTVVTPSPMLVVSAEVLEPAQSPPLASAPLPPIIDPVLTPPESKSAAPEQISIPKLEAVAELVLVEPRPISREFRVEQKPKPYEIPEGVEFNGDLLRQVRMAKGLSLLQVSSATRISMKHLENVEGDRYDGLPATVYLRGILMNLARELGLDGVRVSKSYLSFVDASRAKG
jgi:Helix-turn-helix domain